MFQQAYLFVQQHISGQSILVLILVFWVILEFSLSAYKKSIKKRLLKQFEEMPDREFADFDTQYYKESQTIDILRIGVILLLCLTGVLYKNPSSFGFLAVAAGAVLVIFRDIIVSFVSFFIILPLYKVGDTVSVSGTQGEIIYIRPLHLGLLGKDDYGEHLGQLYTIPNFKLITEIVKREELKIDSYKMETIDLYYANKLYAVDFSVFFERLQAYLDKSLPLRGIKQVGHYRSFAGHRYKLRIDTKEEWTIIHITFIGKPQKLMRIKADILTFANKPEFLREQN